MENQVSLLRIRLAAALTLGYSEKCQKCGEPSETTDESFNCICQDCGDAYGCEYWREGYSKQCQYDCKNECFSEGINQLSRIVDTIKNKEGSMSISEAVDNIKRTIKEKGLDNTNNFKI